MPDIERCMTCFNLIDYCTCRRGQIVQEINEVRWNPLRTEPLTAELTEADIRATHEEPEEHWHSWQRSPDGNLYECQDEHCDATIQAVP